MPTSPSYDIEVQPASISTLISRLLDDSRDLFQKQMELVVCEIRAEAKLAGQGALYAAIALVFGAITLLALAGLALVWLASQIGWLGALGVVAGVALVGLVVCALLSVAMFKKAKAVLQQVHGQR